MERASDLSSPVSRRPRTRIPTPAPSAVLCHPVSREIRFVQILPLSLLVTQVNRVPLDYTLHLELRTTRTCLFPVTRASTSQGMTCCSFASAERERERAQPLFSLSRSLLFSLVCLSRSLPRALPDIIVSWRCIRRQPLTRSRSRCLFLWKREAAPRTASPQTRRPERNKRGGGFPRSLSALPLPLALAPAMNPEFPADNNCFNTSEGTTRLDFSSANIDSGQILTPAAWRLLALPRLCRSPAVSVAVALHCPVVRACHRSAPCCAPLAVPVHSFPSFRNTHTHTHMHTR